MIDPSLVDYIAPLFSALLGTAISSWLARKFIGKSLKDLEAALAMCHEIKIQLATICVKLDDLEPIKMMIQDHDRKIVALGTRNGRARKYSPNS